MTHIGLGRAGMDRVDQCQVDYTLIRLERWDQPGYAQGRAAAIP